MSHAPALRQTLHILIIQSMKRAQWQTAYKPAVEYVKRKFLQEYFNVQSSTQLDDERLNLACMQLRTNQTVIKAPVHKAFALPSMPMISKIIKVGRYVLANIYGNDFLERNLERWISEYYADLPATYIEYIRLEPHTVHHLKELTFDEAAYIIKRLEQIETKCRKPRAA